MSTPLSVVIGKIIIDSKITDPEHIALVTRVTTDYASLSSRAIGGEDVAAELAIVEASIANIDAATRKAIGTNLSLWISTMLQGILVQLVIPPEG